MKPNTHEAAIRITRQLLENLPSAVAAGWYVRTVTENAGIKQPEMMWDLKSGDLFVWDAASHISPAHDAYRVP